MAVTAGWFGLAHTHAFGGITTSDTAYPIDWLTDTIKISLHTSTYTPNKDTHDFWDDCTNEVSGTGYTSGGATLASKTLAYDATTHVLTFDAADVSWTATAAGWASPRCAVIYQVLTDAAHSPLIGYINFGADQTVAIWNVFKIVFAGTGIFTMSPA
jgi:hypothetical protein